jgi:hypothetical protein
MQQNYKAWHCGLLQLTEKKDGVLKLTSNKAKAPKLGVFQSSNTKEARMMKALFAQKNNIISREELAETMKFDNWEKESKIVFKKISDVAGSLKRRFKTAGLTDGEINLIFICNKGYGLYDPESARKYLK